MKTHDFRKETQKIIEKRTKTPEKPEYEYFEFEDLAPEEILKALKSQKKQVFYWISAIFLWIFAISSKNDSKTLMKSSVLSESLSTKHKDFQKNAEVSEKNANFSKKGANFTQKDKNWDATITHKPRSIAKTEQKRENLTENLIFSKKVCEKIAKNTKNNESLKKFSKESEQSIEKSLKISDKNSKNSEKSNKTANISAISYQ